MKCAIREKNISDHVYFNIKHAYRAVSQPHIGSLIPAYTPLGKRFKAIKKTLTPGLSMSSLIYRTVLHALTGGFMRTRTQMYILKLYSGTSPSAPETVKKCICVFPNQKPWMMGEVQLLIRARDAALRTGDRAPYRANLKRGIRSAKDMHRKKIERQPGDRWQVWQGIQNITNYRGTDLTTINADASLAKEQNSFFARFETHRLMAPSSIQQNLTHPSAT